jgi:iron complex transport system permease protein
MTRKIVVDIRLMKAVVAILAGAALSVSGLQMQTLFRNPLAGPYVLGVSSGASLGVALFILGAPLLGVGGSHILSSFGVAGAAWIGSAAVLAMVGVVSRRIKDVMVILILGMMIGSAVSAVVQILQYLSHEEALKSFVVWTMGSLGDVTAEQLWLLLGAVFVGLVLAVSVIKPMNLLLLGEAYARTMGLDVKRTRTLILFSTTLLAGTVTAFCGPVGFIGLAMPHVARAVFAQADHRVLMPAAAMIGAVSLLVCDIVSKMLTLPLNSVTALLGIPIVVWIVVRNKNIV